jgi:hypothetical protein
VASDGNGNVTLGLQLGYRPARYRFQSDPRSSAGELSAQTTQIGLQVQLLTRKLGIEFAVDRASLRISTASFTTQAYAIAISPPSALSLGKSAWRVSPQVGLEIREYLLIYPDGSLLINNDASLASQRTSVGGPSVRLSLMRPWLKRFTIGAFASGHLPLLLMDGLPTGSALSDPLGSLAWRAAIEGGYWNRAQTWGLLTSVGWARQRIQTGRPRGRLQKRPRRRRIERKGKFCNGLLGRERLPRKGTSCEGIPPPEQE